MVDLNKNARQNPAGSSQRGNYAAGQNKNDESQNDKASYENWIKDGQVDVAAMMRDMASQMNLPAEQRDMMLKQIPELQHFIGDMTEFIESAMQSEEGSKLLKKAETKEGSAQFMSWLFKKLWSRSQPFITQQFEKSIRSIDFTNLTQQMKQQRS